MVDNGKLSTILITVFGAIVTAVMFTPGALEQIVQALMGNLYVQYGAVVVSVCIVLYNALYPRNPVEPVPVE